MIAQAGASGISLQDLLTIASLIIGVAGFLVAYITLQWSRRETRLQSLTEVLGPLVRAMQRLNGANLCRKTCEQIQRAFPDPDKAPEAVERVKANNARYHEYMRDAMPEMKAFEAELASRGFRFPDRVSALLKRAVVEMFEAGKHVNAGSTDQADVCIAKLTSSHREITEYARGWRLSDPFEGLRSRFKALRKVEAEKKSRFDLSTKDLDRIGALVGKRVADQGHNPFTVHPPKKLIDNPGICQADDVIEQLEDSVFEIVFQDGTYEMLTFTELIVFIYQLIIVMYNLAKLHQEMGDKLVEKGAEIKLNMSFKVDDIMKIEVVKQLLSKITFSDSPSNEPAGLPVLGVP